MVPVWCFEFNDTDPGFWLESNNTSVFSSVLYRGQFCESYLSKLVFT